MLYLKFNTHINKLIYKTLKLFKHDIFCRINMVN